MRYELGTNSRVLIGEIPFIGNTANGSFIALTEDGFNFIKELQSGIEVYPENLSDENQQILETVLNFGIFVEEGNQVELINEPTISSAYFHITNYCNYHCIGCYSNNSYRNNSEDLSTEDIIGILRSLRSLGVINLIISGGEPFIRQDIIHILRTAKRDLGFENIIVGSNGSLIDANLFHSLVGIIDSLVIAIDGYSEENPSFIRDKGSFEKSIKAIRLAKENNIPVSILPTIHNKNYLHMTEYLKLSNELQVPLSFSILTCDRKLKPFDEYVINEEDFVDLVMRSTSSQEMNIADTPLDLQRISFTDGCGAGRTLISVDARGNVYPCHMLHFEEFNLGNLLHDPLNHFKSGQSVFPYRNSYVEEKEGCKECNFRFFCGGGCKARAYLEHNDIMGMDPYCSGYQLNFQRFIMYLSDLKDGPSQL